MKLILAVAFIFFAAAKAHPVIEFAVETDVQTSIKCTVSNYELPDDQWKNCSSKCIAIKEGIFDETNGFNIENIVKFGLQNVPSESVARSIAEKCAVTRKESETTCEWFRRGGKCFEAEGRLRN